MKLHGLMWWIDRWRKSTAYTDMSLEEQGAYRNLIDEAHLRGGKIPNSEKILAKSCGDSAAWERVRSAVLAHFKLRADGWHQPTLDKIRAESLRLAKKQQRYRNRHKAGNVAETSGKRSSKIAPSPSPSPSPYKEDLNTKRGSGGGASPHHRDAAYEGPRALWVPQRMHADFVKLLNKPDAERELLTWYAAVASDWSDGSHKHNSPGADMYAFWRDRFSEQWPRPAAATGGRRRPAWAIEADS